MTKAQEKQLVTYGYKNMSLESLLNEMPQNIWLSPSKTKNKRERVNFTFTREETYWTGLLTSKSTEADEVFVLHRIKKGAIIDVVVAMILYIQDNKMLSPNV